MAFCSNCGNVLRDGAKFCDNCGATVEPKAGDNKRKMVYEGSVHKCPNCGEVLESFTAFCPACGFELRDTKTSDTFMEFSMKLIETESVPQKISLIKNFPVPNNKEDICEFMLLASTNVSANKEFGYDSQNKIVQAWLVKTEQCYQKGKLLFKSSEDRANIEKIYHETYQALDEAQKQTKKKYIIGAILRTAGVWAALIVFVIGMILDTTTHAETSLFHVGGMIVMAVGAIIICIKATTLVEPLIGIGCGVITLLFGIMHEEVFNENGSAIAIAGGVALIISCIGIIFAIKRSKKSEKSKETE